MFSLNFAPACSTKDLSFGLGLAIRISIFARSSKAYNLWRARDRKKRAYRKIIGGTPVQDLFDDGVLSVHALATLSQISANSSSRELSLVTVVVEVPPQRNDRKRRAFASK